MARKFKVPTWGIYLLVAIVVLFFFVSSPMSPMNQCPETQYYCAGVGCVSGPDKCVPGNKGGPSKVFSAVHESFGNSTVTCPDNTRSPNGQCLLEFPTF